MESESGIKLLYKSFLKTDADEDIVSGFLTAFHHFSVEEFHQSLESIEMGGLRWTYILEPKYKLLFVAADNKNIKTGIIKGKLNVIENAFIKQYKNIWEKRGETWDGDLNIFLPFHKTLEDYYHQWEEVENVSQIADFFDILGIFQHILILLRNIIEKRMYSKSKELILDHIEEKYNQINKLDEFCEQKELKNISFTKDSWFNLIDINLIKCDKEVVINYLKSMVKCIVNILMEVKTKNNCFKYFSDGRVYAYLYNNMTMLKDLSLDLYFLEVFLIL
ncbi:MAG: hypothetical protein EU533_09170 [Promethearchaeota archaeon]|nr:MAG: hypothetical protein EU533_09170 [Candidatus Lokiarchaeota archaeon]